MSAVFTYKEITEIPLDRIHHNEENPNAMTPEMQSALTKEIEREGFHGAIEVRPCTCEAIDKSHYKTKAGEHRVYSLIELGLKMVPALVDLRKLPDLVMEQECDLRMINDNRIRGNVIPEKLAFLIIKHAKKKPTVELQKRLYVNEDQLKKIVNPKLNEQISEEQIAAKREIKQTGVQPRFSCTIERFELDKVEEVLTKIAQENKCSLGHALFILAQGSG